MPYIEARVSTKLDDKQKTDLKSAFGKALALINKPEKYLMVGIEDDYDLYFGGEKLEKGAYISVSLLGDAGTDAYNALTAEVCRIMLDVVGIPADKVYVTFHPVKDWGWNGGLF